MPKFKTFFIISFILSFIYCGSESEKVEEKKIQYIPVQLNKHADMTKKLFVYTNISTKLPVSQLDMFRGYKISESTMPVNLIESIYDELASQLFNLDRLILFMREQFSYKSDATVKKDFNWISDAAAGSTEMYLFPYEFLFTKEGDCEDFSFLFSTLARKIRKYDQRMFSIVSFSIRTHVVGACLLKHDSKYYVLIQSNNDFYIFETKYDEESISNSIISFIKEYWLDRTVNINYYLTSNVEHMLKRIDVYKKNRDIVVEKGSSLPLKMIEYSYEKGKTIKFIPIKTIAKLLMKPDEQLLIRYMNKSSKPNGKKPKDKNEKNIKKNDPRFQIKKQSI